MSDLQRKATGVSGEQRAMIGYYAEYRISAQLIYDCLRQRELQNFTKVL